jgi:hypothetical protein
MEKQIQVGQLPYEILNNDTPKLKNISNMAKKFYHSTNEHVQFSNTLDKYWVTFHFMFTLIENNNISSEKAFGSEEDMIEKLIGITYSHQDSINDETQLRFAIRRDLGLDTDQEKAFDIMEPLDKVLKETSQFTRYWMEKYMKLRK